MTVNQSWEPPHVRNERVGSDENHWPFRKFSAQQLTDMLQGDEEVKRELRHRCNLLVQILETTPRDVLGKSVWNWV